jgi:predicted permease
VLARLGVEPDVVVAAAGSLPPFSGGGNSSGSLHIDGRVDTPGAALPSADWRIASPGYFRALGIHVRGREFDARDTAAAPRVVIVSEETARRYWPGEDAIGKRVVVKSFGPEPATIVGVVADVPIHRVDAPLRPTVYGPLPAYAVWRPISLVVRTRGEPTTAIAAVRAAVASLDPGVPVADVDTAEDSVSGSLGPRRFPMVLLGAFAGVALALACVGLFGVMAYLVAQRTREIGLRMALGARPGDVFRLIIGHGLALTLAGVAIGLVGAMWLSKLLEGLLYGVAPTDALALAGAAVVLVSVSAAACYVPARRAMRVDPMAALRHE